MKNLKKKEKKFKTFNKIDENFFKKLEKESNVYKKGKFIVSVYIKNFEKKTKAKKFKKI